ncbi:MAG TPA: hypothetical protein VG538_17345 [Vicinamibacterales bacterium]|nr:hypothetical protein [Vicinamibacterales bacterium]
MNERSLMEPSCDRSADWSVTQCACGQITIRLGRVRLDVSREELAELHRVLDRAMVEFAIAPSPRVVHHTRVRAH